MPAFFDKRPQFEAEPNVHASVEQFVDALNRIQIMVPRGYIGRAPIDVQRIDDQLIFSIDLSSQIFNPVIGTFVVIEEYDDLLKCVPFNYTYDEPQIHDEDLGTEDSPTTIQQHTIDALDAADAEAALEAEAEEAAEDPDETDDDGDEDDGGDPPPPTSNFKPGFVYIAKARLLQRTPFHEQTVTLRGLDVTYSYATELGRRTASSPGLRDENQVVTPPYFSGDIITAKGNLVTGYTTDDADVVSEEGELYSVVWEDMNQGGRQWAVDPGS